MHLPKTIGLIGPAGSGKTQTAKYLESLYGYRRKPFAEPLKAALMAMGLSEDEVNGRLKEIPLPVLCGKSPRQAMQLLGTEWGRNCIGENFWTNLWAHRTHDLNLVVDDVRFPNEVEAVKARDGIIVRVRRPNGSTTEHSQHASETSLRDHQADYDIWNYGSLTRLRESIEDVVRAYNNDFAGVPKAFTTGSSSTTAG